MAICTSEKRKDGFQHSQRAVLKGSSLTHKLKALSIWPPLSERSTSGDRCLRVDECMNGSISEWMNTTKTLPTPKWSHSVVWTLYHSLPSLVSCVLMSLCKPSLFTAGPCLLQNSRKAWSTKAPLRERAKGAFIPSHPAFFVSFAVFAFSPQNTQRARLAF